MYKYRISKYNTKYRNKKGVFLKNDWTSYSDIGKSYLGKILIKKDYLLIENLYCDRVINIIKKLKIKNLIIKDLEIYEPDKYVINILNELNAKNIFNNLKNNLSIEIENLEIYLRLLLREAFWCNLIDNKLGIKIEIGYDFYLYVYCGYIDLNFIEHYKNKGLFIEKL